MKKLKFKLMTHLEPQGDQPQAIEKLTEGILKGYREQTLMGVTGSGKTFTMANVIQNLQKLIAWITSNSMEIQTLRE